jgi:hypothetical protein
MKYQVEVRELLNRVVLVEAPDQDSAIARVEEAYSDGEIILDYNDFVGPAEFEIVKYVEPDDIDDAEVDYTVEAENKN